MAKKLRQIVTKKPKHPGDWTGNIHKTTMNNFVGHYIENSKITHDGLRRKFIKTFGRDAHDKHFDKLIHQHVD